MIGVTMVALQFIVLHTLDGRDLYVNPAHIVSIGRAREGGDPRKQLTGKVHCIVSLLDGGHVTVEEDCDSVRHRLEE